MGWDNVFNCEKDAFCRKILQHYWPQAKSHEDIYQFNATQYRGLVDIISGGFPCQPFSQAGRRKGKTDDRYLWPEARRVITEAQPEWIVLENVAGLFTILEPESLSDLEIKEIELFCKDGKQEATTTILRLQRRIIGSIISEIGSAGYVLPRLEDGTPVVLCIPACAINAPHRRDRVWFIAHSQHHADRQNFNRPGNAGDDGKYGERWKAQAAFDKGCTHYHGDTARTDSDSDGNGRHGCDKQYEIFTGEGWKYAQYDAQQAGSDAADPGGKGLEGAAGKGIQGNGRKPARNDQVPGWDEWPAQSPVCGGDDGISRQLDGITFPRWRTESIKGFGNAIVPQVALEIFKSISAVFN